jgi:hypothetical protein
MHSLPRSQIGLKHRCISAILSLFFALFPLNLKKTLENNPQYFHLSNFTASKRMHCRILLLTAVGYFLREEEANHAKFSEYVDSLFITLLEPDSTACFQKIVLDILVKEFPSDRRNRHRIDLKYLPVIEVLQKSVTERIKAMSGNPPGPDTDQAAEGKTPGCKTTLLETISTLLDAFYSRWSNSDIKTGNVARAITTDQYPYHHLFTAFDFTPAEPVIPKRKI